MNQISYSQYSMWENCPHAWKLKYVDNHRLDEASIHTVFGTAMHEAIQDWLELLYNNSHFSAKVANLNDSFKDKLLHHFKENTIIAEDGGKTYLADKTTLMQFYQHGCEILDYIKNNFKKVFPTENTKLHSIEYPLEIEVRNNVKYVGYIDIVTYDEVNDSYVLYDLKTSKSGWKDYQKKDKVKTGQLLLYKKFFSDQLNVSLDKISVEFVILKRIIYGNQLYQVPRVSKFIPPHGKPSVKQAWERFENFINTCFDEEGNYLTEQTATPSTNSCRFCVYKTRKDLCPFGVE